MITSLYLFEMCHKLIIKISPYKFSYIFVPLTASSVELNLNFHLATWVRSDSKS